MSDPFEALSKSPPKPIRKAISPEREIPHSIAAEKGVIGAILLEPTESMNACIEAGVLVNWFYDINNAAIFATLDRMFEQQQNIDPITVQQSLKDIGNLDAVGGLAYLSSLMDAVPSAANLPNYIAILKEKNVLRKTLELCVSTQLRIKADNSNPEKLVDEVERELAAIRGNENGKQTAPIKELVRESINSIQRWHQRQGQIGGISTGIRDLDKLTDGLHAGELVVIAARPSVGKTAIAMNITEHVAVDSALPVGVFSLEMTAESLVLRMLCSRARVNARSVQSGILSDGDMRNLTHCAVKITKAPLHIDDTSGLTIQQLRAKARRMSQRHGIKLFVVDYLQLIGSKSDRRGDNRQQEIADVSAGLKGMAKELNVPVIALCQLNRDIEKRKESKPKLSDIRESGSVEQDGDVIGLLYRSEEDDGNDSDSVSVNLFIAKQRNGPAGVDVNMIFRKSLTRFECASPIKE